MTTDDAEEQDPEASGTGTGAEFFLPRTWKRQGWLLFWLASAASSLAVCFRSNAVPFSRGCLLIAPFVLTILPRSEAVLRSGVPAPWVPGSPTSPGLLVQLGEPNAPSQQNPLVRGHRNCTRGPRRSYCGIIGLVLGLLGSWGAWVPHRPERGIIVFGQGGDPQLRREGADVAEAQETSPQLGGICHLSPIHVPNTPQLPARTAAFSPKFRHCPNGGFESTRLRFRL